MILYDFSRFFKILYDYIWFYLIIYDSIWLYMILFDSIWFYLIINESVLKDPRWDLLTCHWAQDRILSRSYPNMETNPAKRKTSGNPRYGAGSLDRSSSSWIMQAAIYPSWKTEETSEPWKAQLAQGSRTPPRPVRLSADPYRGDARAGRWY